MIMIILVDTGRKLNVHKTLNLRPVSMGTMMNRFLQNGWPDKKASNLSSHQLHVQSQQQKH